MRVTAIAAAPPAVPQRRIPSVAVAEWPSARSKRYIGPLAYQRRHARGYARHKPFRGRLELRECDHDPLELPALFQVTVGNGRALRRRQHGLLPPEGSTTTSLISTPSGLGHLWEHVISVRLLRDRRSSNTTRYATTPRLVNLDGEISAQRPTISPSSDAVHAMVPQSSTNALFNRGGASAPPEGAVS